MKKDSLPLLLGICLMLSGIALMWHDHHHKTAQRHADVQGRVPLPAEPVDLQSVGTGSDITAVPSIYCTDKGDLRMEGTVLLAGQVVTDVVTPRKGTLTLLTASAPKAKWDLHLSCDRGEALGMIDQRMKPLGPCAGQPAWINSASLKITCGKRIRE